MSTKQISLISLHIFLLFLLHLPSNLAKQSYIVYLGENFSPAGIASVDKAKELKQTHYDLLASTTKTISSTAGVTVKNDIIYSYTNALNGFAAFLEDDQVKQLRGNPKVKSVFLNKRYELHTTESWNFLGVEKNNVAFPGSIWKNAKYGEDVIIANLDTGVWPESKSFSDQGMGPVPKRFLGSCQTDGTFKCNKKLIGARFFYQGAEASGVRINLTELSPRDFLGHGSHTLSTAGGSFVPGASIFGHGNGRAKGGSPHARVAAYKVCWSVGCYGVDILAAFDAAIGDGVDVISCSIGGRFTDLYSDTTALGAFFAVKRGIVVVASAGNDGPNPFTVQNVSPWIITVGATTMDRDFFSSAILGNQKQFQGTSLSDKSMHAKKFYRLINSADAAAPNSNTTAAEKCMEKSLDPAKVKGKIIVCLRGGNSRTNKGIVSAQAGAVGMILVNDQINGDDLLADPHYLPATHIGYNAGQQLYKYINSTKNPTASITPVKTVVGIKTAPSMASFSSRGPNPIQPGILKPDISAPGVNVLAAYTGAISASGDPNDKRIVPYMIMSGTSMSCPHISGIVGLIKSLHPHWSPAAIKSAIMTSARTTNDNRRTMSEESGNKTTPLAYGAGETRPNSAADPGLVYDITMDDYMNSMCSLGYNSTIMKIFGNSTFKCPKNFNLVDLNYPSITVTNLKDQVTVNRKVKNVGSPGTYTAELITPTGVTGTVHPNKLTFTKTGEEMSFKVVMKSKGRPQSQGFTFGHLIWSDGKHSVRSPIVVMQGV